jgi:hypothetical protein
MHEYVFSASKISYYLGHQLDRSVITIIDMTTVREPSTQRNGRDLEPGSPKEAVLHWREVFSHGDVLID